MDLYIQVGILLLMASALALVIFFYSSPIEIFQSKASKEKEEMNQRIENLVRVELAHFDNAKGITGSQLKEFIFSDTGQKFAILVKTSKSGPSVIEVNKILRNKQANSLTLRYFGLNSNSSNYSAELLNFSAKHSHSVINLFSEPTKVNSSHFMEEPTIADRYKLSSGDIGYQSNKKYIHQDLTLSSNKSVNLPQGQGLTTLGFTDTISTNTDGMNSYSTTGYLYTDNSIYEGEEQLNYHILNSSSSPYKLSNSSRFYTAFIKDTSGLIVGMYAEEMDSLPFFNPLASARYYAGNN